jgi:hypothetical protein
MITKNLTAIFGGRLTVTFSPWVSPVLSMNSFSSFHSGFLVADFFEVVQ